MDEVDEKLKVVLLGDQKVGKTCLVNRLIHDTFLEDTRSTIGAAFHATKCKTNSGQEIMVCLWDTAGQEQFQAMIKTYYRSAKLALICYDLTERRTFERAKLWIGELRDYEENCMLYLCGCKQDLIPDIESPTTSHERARRKTSPSLNVYTQQNTGGDCLGKRAVDIKEVETYVQTAKIHRYLETSSKSGYNVSKILQFICEDYAQLTMKDQDAFFQPKRSRSGSTFKIGRVRTIREPQPNYKCNVITRQKSDASTYATQ